MPRHPPCALKNFNHNDKKIKMLASTVQFSSYGRSRPAPAPTPQQQGGSSGPGGPTHRSKDRPEVKALAHSLRTQQRAETTPTPSLQVPSGKPVVLRNVTVMTANWSMFHP